MRAGAPRTLVRLERAAACVHVPCRAGSAGDAGDAAMLAQHSPAFLWLLRDFYLQLEEEGGRKISARDYLETALRPVAGSGPSVEAKNGIRTSIASLFPQRDCFTLVNGGRPRGCQGCHGLQQWQLARMHVPERARLPPAVPHCAW